MKTASSTWTPVWAERLREERFDYSDEELRPYFALPAVLGGLFQLIERLFGHGEAATARPRSERRRALLRG